MRRARAILAILVGLGIAATWTGWWLAGTIPEMDIRPVRTVFHIVAELSAAAFLVVGGVALLAGRRWAVPVHLASLGLAIYASLEGSGYFAAAGNPLMAVIAGAPAVLAGGAVVAEAVSAALQTRPDRRT